MNLYHTTPCKECPWRKAAVAGWLGGHPATYYSDAVGAGEVPACHLRDHGPENGNTAFCAGALICMRNQAMLPLGKHEGQETAQTARDSVEPSGLVFAHHRDFYEHHTGRKWVPEWQRRMQEKAGNLQDD